MSEMRRKSWSGTFDYQSSEDSESEYGSNEGVSSNIRRRLHKMTFDDIPESKLPKSLLSRMRRSRKWEGMNKQLLRRSSCNDGDNYESDADSLSLEGLDEALDLQQVGDASWEAQGLYSNEGNQYMSSENIELPNILPLPCLPITNSSSSTTDLSSLTVSSTPPPRGITTTSRSPSPSQKHFFADCGIQYGDTSRLTPSPKGENNKRFSVDRGIDWDSVTEYRKNSLNNDLPTPPPITISESSNNDGNFVKTRVSSTYPEPSSRHYNPPDVFGSREVAFNPSSAGRKTPDTDYFFSENSSLVVHDDDPSIRGSINPSSDVRNDDTQTDRSISISIETYEALRLERERIFREAPAHTVRGTEAKYVRVMDEVLEFLRNALGIARESGMGSGGGVDYTDGENNQDEQNEVEMGWEEQRYITPDARSWDEHEYESLLTPVDSNEDDKGSSDDDSIDMVRERKKKRKGKYITGSEGKVVRGVKFCWRKFKGVSNRVFGM